MEPQAVFGLACFGGGKKHTHDDSYTKILWKCSYIHDTTLGISGRGWESKRVNDIHRSQHPRA